MSKLTTPDSLEATEKEIGQQFEEIIIGYLKSEPKIQWRTDKVRKIERLTLEEAKTKLIDLMVGAQKKEMDKLMDYCKILPGVFFEPTEKEKLREFSRASIIMAKYAHDRIAQLNTYRDGGGK